MPENSAIKEDVEYKFDMIQKVYKKGILTSKHNKSQVAVDECETSIQGIQTCQETDLDKLLCSVIICFLLQLINFCLPLGPKPFKGFLVLNITCKGSIIMIIYLND